MKYQRLFSGKNKTNFVNLSPEEFIAIASDNG